MRVFCRLPRHICRWSTDAAHISDSCTLPPTPRSKHHPARRYRCFQRRRIPTAFKLHTPKSRQLYTGQGGQRHGSPHNTECQVCTGGGLLNIFPRSARGNSAAQRIYCHRRRVLAAFTITYGRAGTSPDARPGYFPALCIRTRGLCGRTGRTT